MFSEKSANSLKQFKPSLRAAFSSLVFILILSVAIWYFSYDMVRKVYEMTFGMSFWTAETIALAQKSVVYFSYGLAGLGVLTIGFQMLRLWSICYEITATRLMYHHGILVRRHDEIELRRIRDFQVIQPIFSRTVGLGKIYLVTRDETHPTLTIGPFVAARTIQEEIRAQVIAHQQETGYREIEGY